MTTSTDLTSTDRDALPVSAAIDRGLEYLRRRQLPSGEFTCYMSTDPALEQNAVVDSSPFPTALIAYSIGFSDTPATKTMLENATRFFLAEMEGNGLWRYWTRQHQHHAAIPPDLDDVACISLVLRRRGTPFPDNRALVLANRDRRGLFHTWLTPRWPMPLNPAFWRVVVPQWFNPVRCYYFWKVNESARHDVDGVVNANVLCYLGERFETQPVVRYLIDVVRQGNEACCDKWHLNPFTFYYTVARCLDAGVQALAVIRDDMIARIVAAAKSDGAIGDSVLDTALAVCALRSLQSAAPELTRAVRYLVAQQRSTGEWPRSVLYYGGPKKY